MKKASVTKKPNRLSEEKQIPVKPPFGTIPTKTQSQALQTKSGEGLGLIRRMLIE